MRSQYSQKREVFFSTVLMVLLLFLEINVFSQTTKTTIPGGALFLPTAEYDKLPKANLESIKNLPQANSKFMVATTTVKMLATPPIGDQGTQASCVGWSNSYALSILTYPKYSCWGIAQRSPSFIYNQIKLGGCGDGAYLNTGTNFIINIGSCSKRSMSYNPNNCSTQPTSEQNYDASKNNASSRLILTAQDYQSMKSALDQGYPVVVGFVWNQSTSDMWYNGGGIWSSNYGQGIVGHAVCIVGYDDGLGMFKVINSMGTTNGDNGFFWITYNLVMNGAFQEAYVIQGMNSTLPFSLSGPTPSLVCSSGATFTLNHQPSGTSINWSSTSNLTKYSSSGNTAIYKAALAASSSGYVTAGIDSCTCAVQYAVWAGVPQMTNQKVDGSSYTPGKQICPGNHWLDVTPVGTGAGNATWTVPSGIQYIAGTNTLDFTFPSNLSSISISAKSSNSCGTSINANYYLTKKTSGCPYSLNINLYPNPASDNISVTIISDSPVVIPADSSGIQSADVMGTETIASSTYTISIFNSQSSLVSQTTRSGQNFSVPLKNLKDGIYVIEVKDGNNNFSRQQFIVKHN